VRELASFHVDVQIQDPLACPEEARREYGLTLSTLEALRPADAVILAVSHDEYVRGGWPLVQRLLNGGKGIVLDVKSQLDRAAKPHGIELWRL
jgi:UDP-N-acetyl-D-galactosamine dehydrogenase